MLSLISIPWRAASAAAVLAVSGIGWSVTHEGTPKVPHREPLPAAVQFTDGVHTWKLKAEKIGLNPQERHLDLGKASQALKSIANQASYPGKSADIVLTPDGIRATRSQMSRRVDIEKTLRRLMEYTSSAYPETPISLAIVKKPPRVTTEDLAKIKAPIAEYVTRYNEGDRLRSQNVRMVADRLNGAILQPGEVFSFNEWVGPRNAKNGYKPAKIFQNGKMVIDTGGGTCQVTSTLYNSVLLAGLKIVERTNHSLTVPYVKPGRDATVYYGQLDFKFKNTTDAPIYIRSVARRGRMRVTLYGAPQNGPKVEIVSSSRRRGNLVFAQAARLFKENGKVVKREHLSSDVYKPLELAEIE